MDVSLHHTVLRKSGKEVLCTDVSVRVVERVEVPPTTHETLLTVLCVTPLCDPWFQVGTNTLSRGTTGD